MTWHTLPNETRKVTATEARLDAIYKAARNGLKGDALALASGMLPTEYRQLCQLDPIAEMAELKGRADGEMEVSGLLHEARVIEGSVLDTVEAADAGTSNGLLTNRSKDGGYAEHYARKIADAT